MQADKLRHDLCKKQCPDAHGVYGIPWTGIENASAEMKALARPKMDRTKVPFDPPEYAEHLDQLPFDPDVDPAIGQ
mgnify:FL=1